MRRLILYLAIIATGVGWAADELPTYSLTYPPVTPIFVNTPTNSVTSDWLAANAFHVAMSACATNVADSITNTTIKSDRAYRLESAEIGFPWQRVKPEYYLADRITAPDDVDWRATAERYEDDMKAGKADAGAFLFNVTETDPCVYAADGGNHSLTWVMKDGHEEQMIYTVGSVCQGRPRRIFWTDYPYNGQKISLQGKFVRFFGSAALVNPATGTVTNTVGGVVMVQENVVTQGLYLDTSSMTLEARGQLTGQVLMAYYASGSYDSILCVQVVEICEAKPNVLSATVGAEVKPIAKGYSGAGLSARVSAGVGDSLDGFGDYLYQHAGQHTYSPKNGEVFAIRPTMNMENGINEYWKAEVTWMETDPMNVQWPFEIDRYLVDWPKDIQRFVRGDKFGDLGADIVITNAYVAELQKYQYPSDHALGVGADGRFRTKGEGKALLKLTGDDNVWFLPVESIMRTNRTYYTLTPSRVNVGAELELRSGTRSGVASGVQFTATSEIPGYIYQSGTPGKNYDVNLYSATNGASAVYAVSTNGDIEVWWSERFQAPGMSAPIAIPVLPQIYRPVWPAPDEAPQIVIASREGSANEMAYARYGAAYFDAANASMTMPWREYFNGDAGTVMFWTRSAHYNDVMAVTNAPGRLITVTNEIYGTISAEIANDGNGPLVRARVGNTSVELPLPKDDAPNAWHHVALTFGGESAPTLHLDGAAGARKEFATVEAVAADAPADEPLANAIEPSEGDVDLPTGDRVAYNGETELAAGVCYEVTGVLTNSTIYVKGTPESPTSLILADGAALTVNGGIRVLSGNALNIYAQSSDTKTMGRLIAKSGDYSAGIGGEYGKDGGEITIYGGMVTATGGFAAAGIGGGCYGAGGKCVISNGVVTATGGNEGAGIGGGYQRTGGEITIYGGCVTALASGGSYASGAGIGGGSAYQNEGCPGGTITIYGGTVTATGNSSGAGIGGGYAGSGGVITIFGGRVTATGGWNAAGIGGGKHNIGANGAGTIKINGGTVDAKGQNGGQDIGIGNGGSGGTVTITGGSVLASQSKVNPAPKDATNKPLYRVTVAGFSDGEPVTIDGLENYGLKDIYPIDGNVYLYLPNGSYTFTVDDQTYAATVNDKATEATIVQFVSFLRWNGTELEPDRIASPTVVSGSTTTIGSAAGAWYVVKGEVTTTNLKVSGTAHLILADGATLAATNGVRVSEGNALNIYAQSEGAKMGRLVATSGDVDCAVIGGGSGERGGAISIFGGSVNVTCPPAKCFGACIGGGRGAAGNKVTIRGGEVTVVCSDYGYGAGIGGGGQQRDDLASSGGSGGTIEISGGVVIVDKAGGGRGAAIGGGGAIGNNATGGSGGTIRISGGRVFVSGRGYGGAGIGGGGAYSYSERGTAEGGGGTIEISGGTVVTEMEDGGLGIGGGFRAMDYSTGLDRYCSAKVTITGGSVLASDVKDDPVDGAKQRLYPVTLTGLSDGERVTITELDGYGTKDIYAAGGQVCLWLPDGTHVFSVNGMDFAVTVNGAVTVATEVSVVPYLRWNGTEMVPDRAYGVSALSDSATTIGSADGSWYVVTGLVTTATLTVNGTANLILADGANLTATGGVRVTEGNTFNIYAQSEGEGMGRLIAKGGKRFAGIGGSAEAAGGTIIIHGGRVAATGGEFAAGIGGGRETAGGTIIIHGGEVAARGFYGAGIGGGQNAPCGTVTINGGRVTASGAVDASSVIGGAGIGGGGQNAAGSITVNGGVVTATGGLRCAGLGCSYRGTGGRVAITGGTVTAVGGGSLDADIGGSDVAVTIDGGCVFGAKALVDPAPLDSADRPVRLVTLDCPGAEGPVRVEGLEGYGTKDIYPIEGKVYLYLPAGRFTPTINGVTYDVIVFDSDTDRIPVDYIGLNGTTPVSLSAEAALVTENTEWIGTGLIGGAGWYVVTNDVTIFDLKVLGTANLILADGATLTAGGSDGTAIGEGHAGVEVGEGATLRIYAQAGGTGALRAVGSERGAGIGGNGNCSCGTVEIFGGRITAASGGSTGYGAGIGGGCFGDGGTVRIHAGTVIAVGGKGAEDIGGGYCGAGASVTVTGGSVYTSESRIADAPVDGDGKDVWRVTLALEAADDKPVEITGLDGYCTFGVFPFAGRLYPYLPQGNYSILADGLYYGCEITAAGEVRVDDTVDYLAWTGEGFELQSTNRVTMIDSSLTTWKDGGWYAAIGDVTLDAVTVSGTANLILADGATLTVNGGIRVTEGNTLNVYAQSAGTGMGKLVATGAVNCAGIGGENTQACGHVAIHGGFVTATGGNHGAGIGGGGRGSQSGGAGGTVEIFGGQVTAKGINGGAAIGGGNRADGGTIVISGGEVIAKNDSGSGGSDGAGIGGGYTRAAGMVTITGGKVTARGGAMSKGGAAGIGGGGDGGSGGTVSISGGTVTATGGGNGADIGNGVGGSGVTVTITGGNVYATRSLVSPAPTNAANEVVYCVTVDVEKLNVEGLEGYGTNDLYPIDGKAYLWLPNGTYAFTVNGVGYTATVAGGAATATQTGGPAATPERIAASVRAMVSNLDLAALTAAPVASTPTDRPALKALSVESDGIDLTVAGGVPGCAYTLYAAEDLAALGDGGAGRAALPDTGVKAYGPEVCGADGTVTFRGVKRPAADRGFFTIGVGGMKGE